MCVDERVYCTKHMTTQTAWPRVHFRIESTVMEIFDWCRRTTSTGDNRVRVSSVACYLWPASFALDNSRIVLDDSFIIRELIIWLVYITVSHLSPLCYQQIVDNGVTFDFVIRLRCDAISIFFFWFPKSFSRVHTRIRIRIVFKSFVTRFEENSFHCIK